MYQEKKDETGKRNFLEQQNETIARNERINDRKEGKVRKMCMDV